MDNPIRIGLVLGSGLNIAYQNPLPLKQDPFASSKDYPSHNSSPSAMPWDIINSEIGCFPGIELSIIDRRVTEQSDNPKIGFLEKRVSGSYISRWVYQFLLLAVENNLIDKDGFASIFSKHNDSEQIDNTRGQVGSKSAQGVKEKIGVRLDDLSATKKDTCPFNTEDINFFLKQTTKGQNATDTQSKTTDTQLKERKSSLVHNMPENRIAQKSSGGLALFRLQEISEKGMIEGLIRFALRRSAYCAALALSATIASCIENKYAHKKINSDSNQKEKVILSINGSVLTKMHGYAKIFFEYLDFLTEGLNVEIEHCLSQRAPVFGSLIAEWDLSVFANPSPSSADIPSSSSADI